MIAVDTNILARFILEDDAHQAEVAWQVLRRPFHVPYCVLAELGWVLETSSGFAREEVAGALSVIVNMAHCHLADADGVRWAIARYAAGADWADMVHLVAAAPSSDSFYSFDRKLTKQAGTDTPLPVTTI